MALTSNGFVSAGERRNYLEQLLAAELPGEVKPRTLLARLRNPAVRGPFLEALLRQPLPRIQGFIRDLTATADVAAVPILAPLLHSLDQPVVLAVIEALTANDWAAAAPALRERAAYDRRPDVRNAASAALNTLPDEPSNLPQPMLLPLHSAYLTAVDGAGAQMAIVARRWSDAGADDVDTPEAAALGAEPTASLHVIFDDVVGIREAFGFPLQPAEEYVDILDDLEDDGLTPVQVPLTEIREAIDAAYERSLSRRGRVSVPFVAWRAMLQGDDPRAIVPIKLPDVTLERHFEAFTHANELLDLDEFGTWYFEPDEISSALEELSRLQKRRGEGDYERRVVALIRKTLSSNITPERRDLIRQRLLRQAPLLLRIYEDVDPARRALVAAAGLAEDSGIEPTEHPLLQAMLVQSFEDALGEPLVDEHDSDEP